MRLLGPVRYVCFCRAVTRSMFSARRLTNDTKSLQHWPLSKIRHAAPHFILKQTFPRPYIRFYRLFAYRFPFWLRLDPDSLKITAKPKHQPDSRPPKRAPSIFQLEPSARVFHLTLSDVASLETRRRKTRSCSYRVCRRQISSVANGLRKCVADDFEGISKIYLYNNLSYRMPQLTCPTGPYSLIVVIGCPGYAGVMNEPIKCVARVVTWIETHLECCAMRTARSFN